MEEKLFCLRINQLTLPDSLRRSIVNVKLVIEEIGFSANFAFNEIKQFPGCLRAVRAPEFLLKYQEMNESFAVTILIQTIENGKKQTLCGCEISGSLFQSNRVVRECFPMTLIRNPNSNPSDAELTPILFVEVHLCENGSKPFCAPLGLLQEQYDMLQNSLKEADLTSLKLNEGPFNDDDSESDNEIDEENICFDTQKRDIDGQSEQIIAYQPKPKPNKQFEEQQKHFLSTVNEKSHIYNSSESDSDENEKVEYNQTTNTEEKTNDNEENQIQYIQTQNEEQIDKSEEEQINYNETQITKTDISQNEQENKEETTDVPQNEEKEQETVNTIDDNNQNNEPSQQHVDYLPTVVDHITEDSSKSNSDNEEDKSDDDLSKLPDQIPESEPEAIPQSQQMTPITQESEPEAIPQSQQMTPTKQENEQMTPITQENEPEAIPQSQQMTPITQENEQMTPITQENEQETIPQSQQMTPITQENEQMTPAKQENEQMTPITQENEQAHVPTNEQIAPNPQSTSSFLSPAQPIPPQPAPLSPHSASFGPYGDQPQHNKQTPNNTIADLKSWKEEQVQQRKLQYFFPTEQQTQSYYVPPKPLSISLYSKA